ncbi:glycerophosphoryl diester phosphodiesterase [Paenibacillus rhizosphaerae]|uniref:Glycerophosphoryl diester phosphodiesterase n=1 Tax=Paenibacillus rhizosphaerae TaxID=297318 RepID=A0A839TMY4_9BACL|nr:glycerophosphodiester phosphodiesterase [Paenibacillus rhizosphaerae]MBB3128135.1 glycerophosphoryl diester phosphodiesterase [Paenibacillus rhizosphaerae]
MTAQFPLITAHSGCMDTLDNTLFSIETGIRLGADIIEEDVRVTRDGIAVLAHDDEWQTAEDGRLIRISEMSMAELQELVLSVNYAGKSGTMTIARLDEMLDRVRAAGISANLDLKTDDSVAAAAALVHQYKMADQVLLSGCGPARAMLVQQTHPEFRKLLNVDTDLFLTQDYRDAVRRSCEDAAAAACIGLNVPYQLVKEELLEQAAARSLPVFVWTVNEETLMERFARMGVASITTRNVDALVRLKGNLHTETTKAPE